MRRLADAFIIPFLCYWIPHASPLNARELLLSAPVSCEIGSQCLIQQLPDMGQGELVIDPLCGSATYQGHSGIDIRIKSMADVGDAVKVTAAADGVVLRTRDRISDRLVRSEEDRRGIDGLECGNGVVIAHEGGYETQYCHLRKGSITVGPGESVKRGQPIGEIGASGLAEFPHVHLALRRDGQRLDPVSGKALEAGCSRAETGEQGFLAPDFYSLVSDNLTAIADYGLAGSPVSHDQLVVSGAPPGASISSDMAVLWAWFINLRQGDRIGLSLTDPSGRKVVDRVTAPRSRNKASYSMFAGQRGQPASGIWLLEIVLIREGKVIINKMEKVEVR